MSAPSESMGIVNRDTMTMKSGITLENAYMSFTSRAQTIPDQIAFSYSTDRETGERRYFAYANIYVYASADTKSAGKTPVEVNPITIPVDQNAVFGVLYDALKSEYPNYVDQPDQGEEPPREDAPQEDAPEEQAPQDTT